MGVFNLIIDSSKRISSSTSSTNFVLNFPGNFPEIQYARFNWVQVPLSTYTISTSNQTITFSENVTIKTAIILVGYYTGSTLATAIQTALNTVSGGYNTYVVTYNPDTYKMTFS